MSPALPQSRGDSAGRFFASVKSLHDFDDQEVWPIMQTLVNPDQRAICYRLLHQRTRYQVGSLMRLDSAPHFQAINMIARSLFEIDVDLKLVSLIPDAIQKMSGFIDVEKLRCAKKVINLKAKNPSSQIDDSLYKSYVASEEARITTLRGKLWPSVKKIEHWSTKNLKERCDLIGDPYARHYEFEYPRMSWQVHTGLTGIANFKTEAFTGLAGAAFSSSVTSYEAILKSMIKEFQIGRTDEKILGKLKAAKLLPFTESPEEAQQVMREAVR
jgi:hypothetical protein